MLMPSTSAPSESIQAALSAASADWSDGVNAQIGYWVAVIRRESGFEEAHDRILSLLDPERPLTPWVASRLPPGEGPVRILDVGVGPTASVGWRCEGRAVEVTGVDPLALVCNDLLAEQGLRGPSHSVQCDAEMLGETFPFTRYHIVHMHSALDQCRDPARALEAALEVLEPDGKILLSGLINDGERCAYYALHQWNIEPQGSDDLRIWRPGCDFSLKALLAGRAELGVTATQDSFRAEITLTRA